MGGWMEVKAVLGIAYSNQESSFHLIWAVQGWGFQMSFKGYPP
jgi:hypothetical protein